MRKGIGFLLILSVVAVFSIPAALFADTENDKTRIELPLFNIETALTAEEKSWLRDHQTIQIAGPQSFPPFHYYEKGSVLKGMSADYIHMIMLSLGVTVKVQKDLPWPEVLRRVRAHEVDLISCIAKTADREGYLEFSKPYLSFPLVILSRKDALFISGLDDLHGKKVAVVKNVSTEVWLKRDGIDILPYYVNSPLQAIEAVSFGQADVTIENLAAASYLIQENGLNNVKIAAPTTYGNYDLHIAVRKDWPQLVSIVNKVLESISPEQHSAIHNKWLSVRYEYGIQPLDILKWVLLVVMIATLILAVFLIWNKRLQQEIIERKKAETERLKLIEELLEALDNIKTLKGLVPICAKCKKIRDDEGFWNHVEAYIEKHSDARFSHGICEECAEELYRDTKWFKKKKREESNP